MITTSAHRIAMTRECSCPVVVMDRVPENSSNRLLISYDTPAIAHQKAQYIDQMGLGGGMWWELDADKPFGAGSLVEVVVNTWGQLETRQNELEYPGSSEYGGVASVVRSDS